MRRENVYSLNRNNNTLGELRLCFVIIWSRSLGGLCTDSVSSAPKYLKMFSWYLRAKPALQPRTEAFRNYEFSIGFENLFVFHRWRTIRIDGKSPGGRIMRHCEESFWVEAVARDGDSERSPVTAPLYFEKKLFRNASILFALSDIDHSFSVGALVAKTCFWCFYLQYPQNGWSDSGFSESRSRVWTKQTVEWSCLRRWQERQQI
jgi:hypothetical protein